MFATRALVAVVAVLVAAQTPESSQLYRVSGKDSFAIGSRELRSDIAYSGKQRLTIRRAGNASWYTAQVDYRKFEQDQSQESTAKFVSLILKSGEEVDEQNADPDFLTVLNQPFAAQLDPQTIRDVRKLKGSSPFSFSPAMTGATLNGSIYHVGDGLIAGHPVVGIGFDATGPMRGTIPEHREILLRGTIRMSGRAYYTSASALLLGLDATLTIAGTLADGSTSDPVKILYRRTIRAE